jgi:tetratricopeptide (TPR) repeat protein
MLASFRSAVLIICVLAAASASAQAPPRDDAKSEQAAGDPIVDDANRILGAANDRFREGDYPGAAKLYEQLLELLGEQRGWRVQFNLGVTYQQMGDPTRAIERFEAFARLSADEASTDKSIAERRAEAQQRIADLQSKHGALRVDVGGRVILVKVGTAKSRPAGFTVYLAPGVHRVEIDSGTAKARQISVTLKAGATVVLEAEPTVASTPPPDKPAPPPPPEEGAFPSALFGVAMALTIASVAIPVGLGLRAASLRDDAAALGTDHPDYPTALEDFEDMRTGYYASYAVPGAFALASLIILVVYAASGDDEAGPVDVSLGPDGANASLQLSF